MQADGAERRRRPGQGRRAESGQGRAETRGTEPRAAACSARGSEEQTEERFKELITAMQQKENQTEERGRRLESEDKKEDKEAERERSRDGRRRTERRPASEGRDRSDDSESLRWRLNRLEKEKLELVSSHNQELCRLEAELTRLRSSVKRDEAQRVELQYQLTLSQKDADRAAKLSRDKQELTERAAELQQTVQELQRALDITRQARDEGQHALQQEVEERDKLILSFGSENQRLHQLLQDHEDALEELERRMAEMKKEKEREAEVNRRQADELKYLSEREERSRREKQLSDERVKSLESSLSAERTAHMESKFNSELIQVRVRDLEAAVAAERSNQQEAQSNLELLRAKFGEVERAYTLERERSEGTERALQRLQAEFEQFKCEQDVALETQRKTTFELSERLQEEQKQHGNTHSLLEKAVRRQSDTEEVFVNFVEQIRETLHQQRSTGCGGPAKDDGSQSSSSEVLQLLKTTLCMYQHKLQETQQQVQDLLFASEKLQEEVQRLRQLTSDQSRQIEESQRVSVRLKEEVIHLRQEGSDWSTQMHHLQTELQKEREERKRETEREREERKKEEERERKDRTAEVQKITEQHQNESKVHLSFLYRLYQRLLAGCVLLDQPQSLLGDFTWEELCSVISEQVDQLTSDLQNANSKIAHLQNVCDKKSVCVRELQRSQESALSRLEESVRRREEAWSSQHTHTVTQLQSELQVCRSQCDSLQDRVSSLDLHCSSLTSDLSRLQGLLARSRKESACFFLACALLAGALKHTHSRLQTLSEQKNLLSRQLAGREMLEEEVRRLADALGGDGDEGQEEEKRGRMAVRRWRRTAWVVLAVRRWCGLAKKTAVLFQLEGSSGGPWVGVCVCKGSSTATRKGQLMQSTGKTEGHSSLARWLHSKFLASVILSSMADLQGVLAHTGSSPVDVMSSARSALSCLLDQLLGQVDKATCKKSRRALQPDMKVLVSTLQQHFLNFSQRLHSTEVERRNLRLEVANLKKGLRQERKDTCSMVPVDRFHSVCEELRQALNREQETQELIREQANQLHTLQLRADTHGSEETNARNALSQTAKALSESRREVSRKERALRILGKHLSGFQKQRKQLEEQLQRAEDELSAASRRKDCLMSYMKAAETSYKEVRDGLLQSEHSLSDQPRPSLLPRQPLEVTGAECIMGTPEVAACQSLLSVVSQLFHTCSSRIDWLEQEVSAHRSHVTALRSELQDACLRDNLAFVPVELVGMETRPSAPSSDLSDEPSVSLNTAAPKPNPVSSSSPPHEVKVKKKKNGEKR